LPDSFELVSAVVVSAVVAGRSGIGSVGSSASFFSLKPSGCSSRDGEGDLSSPPSGPIRVCVIRAASSSGCSDPNVVSADCASACAAVVSDSVVSASFAADAEPEVVLFFPAFFFFWSAAT
jgi:hypothetical protein